LVSVQFLLARDTELPGGFAGLNRYGMPLIPLVVASIIPAAVVVLFPKVEALADLYAIGVVGAVAINLGSISTNRGLVLKWPERGLMLAPTVILIAIEATITIVKPHARSFALLVLVVGLSARVATIVSSKAVPMPRNRRIGYLSVAAAAVIVQFAGGALLPEGWWSFGVSMGAAIAI